jgi:uncharacterized protein YifN (PemK superfamily)
MLPPKMCDANVVVVLRRRKNRVAVKIFFMTTAV